MKARTAVAAALLAAILGFVVAPAVAQEDPDTGTRGDTDEPSQPDDGQRLSIRAVDGTDPDEVSVEFHYSGSRALVVDGVLRENGAIVDTSDPVPIDDFGVAFVVEASTDSSVDARFERSADALRNYLQTRPDDEPVGIVGFNADAVVSGDPGVDTEDLVSAVDALGVADGRALFDAVIAGVNLFDRESELSPIMIVVSSGSDDSSAASRQQAVGLVDELGVLVYGVSLGAPTRDLRAITDASGGATFEAETASDVEATIVAAIEAAKRQYRLTFATEFAGTSNVPLELTIGRAESTITYTPLVAVEQPLTLQPAEAGDRGIGILQNRVVFLLAVLLVIAAVAGVTWSLATTLIPDNAKIETRLSVYGDEITVTDPFDEENVHVRNAVLQRAVRATETFARRRGFFDRTEFALERADVPLRAAEALFFAASFVGVVGIVGLIATRNVLVTLVLLIFAVLIPPAVVAFLASRRRREFNSQLPDMLQLLAGTLRAGYSLMQGVEAASEEVAEPMRKELRRVVSEARLGMPLETSLEGVGERMDSADFTWAVMAIGIQREVGGNLAELLLTVAETMVQRERLRRDVSALTAEGRVSAFVIGGLPLALILVMYTINPDYVATLFSETLGNIMLVYGVVSMIAGFIWMFKTIDIKI